MTMQEFASLVQSQQLARLNKDMPKDPDEFPDFWLSAAQTTIIKGRKYTKVDVGRSGKFMIVNATGEIFGIKAYGVIHKGHFYGTLETVDDYYWGNYGVQKIAS